MIKKVMTAALLLLLVGCGKPQSSNIELETVIDEMSRAVDMGQSVKKDMTVQSTAAKFGVSSDTISDGVVIYSTEGDRPDKIILLRAKSDDVVQDVEFALQTHMTETINAWEKNEPQRTKIDKSLMKTKDDCVILAIVNNADEIEKIFDKYI